MVGVVLCLILTTIATITDLARHSIYNWNTYPGILIALGLRASQGRESLYDGLEGFVACGGIMLLCFVLFDVGGGDVKLLSMTGAFLGLETGIIVMLWTFVIGSMAAVAVVVWQAGFVNLIVGALNHLRLSLKTRQAVPLTQDERQSLARPLYLAPAALVALLLVRGNDLYAWVSST